MLPKNLKYEKGLLLEEFGKMKRPFFFLPPHGLALLVQSYEKIFGKGAKGILSLCFFELGKKTAKSLIEKYNIKNVNEFFEKAREIGKEFNWFKEIKWEEKVKGKEYIIKLWDSPTARIEKKGKACSSFALWFGGLFTVLLNKEFEGEELKCKCEGYEYCEFKVYRNEQRDK